MKQFSAMLQQAVKLVDEMKDEDIENVTVIVSMRPDENGQVNQHTLTNVACPLSHIVQQFQESLRSIVKAKSELFGPEELLKSESQES